MRPGLLDNLPAGVDSRLVARVLDCCRGASEKQEVKFTEFLDPFHLEFTAPLTAGFFGIRHLADGGFPGAEKKRLAIFPDYYSPADIEAPLSALEIRLSDPTRILSHRDYLGALIGLGLNRSWLGDILPFAGGAHIVVAREVAGAALNLDQVNKFKAQTTEVPPYTLSAGENPLRQINATVASLRLDAVLGTGLGIGRSKAVELVKGDRVKVNWRKIIQPGFTLKAGDIISIRGRGRLELSEVGGETKKGRIRIQVNKFS